MLETPGVFISPLKREMDYFKTAGVLKIFIDLFSVAAVNLSFVAVEDVKKSQVPFLCHQGLYERVLYDRMVRGHYSIIHNLNEYLTPFTNLKCLVVFDNFQKVNLKINTTPLLLRRPIPLCQAKYTVASTSFKQTLWGPGTIHFKNISTSLETNINCPLSKFFNATGVLVKHPLPDTCLRLNVQRFWKHTKPWNCKVHISLYPIIYSKEKFGKFGPSPFNVEESPRLYSFSYTSSVPMVHILVGVTVGRAIRPYYLKQWLFQSLYPRGMITSKDVDVDMLHSLGYTQEFRRLDILSQDVYYLMYISRTQLNQNQGISLIEPSAVIQQTSVIRFIPGNWLAANTWDDFSKLISIRFLKNFTGGLKNKFLNSHIFQSSVRNTIWSVHEDYTKDNQKSIYSGILRYLLSCEKFQKINGELLLNRDGQKNAREFTKIWLKIMNNYTLIMRERGKRILICANGQEAYLPFSGIPPALSIGIQRILYKHSLYYTSYFPTKGVHNNYQFVSCGTRALSSLRFEELFGIFDQWIWLAILLLVFLISLLSALLTNHIKPAVILHHCFLQGKVLFEQGGPYSERYFKSSSMRWLLGSYLLVGILLSNAYKNSNVYHLITPRKALPFETFDELRSENFSIYSRIGEVQIENHYQHKRPTTNTVAVDLYPGGSAMFLSGASTLQITVTTEAEDYSYNMAQVNVISEFRKVISLNPTLLPWVTRVYQGIPQIIGPERERKYMHEEMTLFRKQEMDYFFKVMMKCDKVALILTPDMCSAVAQKVKHKKFHQPISVGRNIYYGTNELITLTGFVPQRILTSLKSIGEVGIWDRWMRIFTTRSGSRRRDTGSPPVQPANMQGNLVIVFAVWMGGFGISLILFILEIF